jgi:hypothetical protein
MDIAMRARAVRSAITFDATTGTWTLGKHIVRSSVLDAKSVRFQLFTAGRTEKLVGSYSGAIGATPDSIAQYLVYFLETGKPWHSGLSNRGLN